MNLPVEYSINAQTEIERSYLWIKERSKMGAKRWLDELAGKIETLGEYPLHHPPAPESLKFPHEIRLMLFRKRRAQFRIYYTVEMQRVVILSVRRSSRKPLEEDDVSL